MMDRRHFVSLTGAAGLSAALPGPLLASGNTLLSRVIPSSGEQIPVLGMGTWITFNVGRSKKLRDTRLKVLEAFFQGGGGMIDSSPMYGTSEDVIGYCLTKLPSQKRLFSATKVWTRTRSLGIQQMETSERLWKEDQFDLMQIHNLVDWQTHMETLNQWKADKRIRYTGITTSHGRRHGKFEQIMREQKFDFAQFTYNIADREAEARLLPAAADRGMAVIINRPFQRGALIQELEGKPLPAWASEVGVKSWPQFLLKFVLSHPAVTCAIPATSKPEHMIENLEAGRGIMPDAKMRQRMIAYLQDL